MGPFADVSLTEPPPTASLLADLARGGPTLVALSGGVDSAVVAHLAFRALGDAAQAATLVGPAVSPSEVARARTVAASIGIRHILLPVDPLGSEPYRSNPANRCFFCRQVEASALRAWGASRGVGRYVDGLQSDDLGEDRPGIRAMDEAGFDHPLVVHGWRKPEVRAYARAVDLPNWDAPSDACLASRVATGRRISADLLGRIARGEAQLRDLGFRRVRVRTDGTSARVEVDPQEVARLLCEPTASRVRDALAALGFAPVTLDPAGYRPRPGA